VAFHHSHDLGQKEFEPFRADATTDLPDAGQYSHDLAQDSLHRPFLRSPVAF